MTRHLRPWQLLFAPRDLVRGPLLVVAPHPDDEVIGPGGLVAAHRAAGEAVVTLVMTDGAGGDAAGTGGAGYVELRQAESRAASAVLGGTETRFLEFADGGLADAIDSSPSPADAMESVLRERDFATFVFPSPYEIHPDHRAAGLAALEAAARLEAPPRLLAYEVGEAMPCNLLINVTETFDVKIEALRCFTSQLEHHDLVTKMDAWNRARSVNCDDKAVTHCEAYLRITEDRIVQIRDAIDATVRLTDAMTPRIPYE